MSNPPARRAPPPAQRHAPAPGPPPVDQWDPLRILQQQRVLTAEQAERVRRSAKLNSLTLEQAAIQMGAATEIQIAQVVAAHVGLRYVKMNPLDLDLDIVTKALPGPFARKHGLVALSKTEDRITVAVYDPFRPFPEEDLVAAIRLARRVAGGTLTRSTTITAPAAKVQFKGGTASLSGTVTITSPAAKVNFKAGTASLTTGSLLTAPAAKINFMAGVAKLSITRTAPAAKINFKAAAATLISAALDDVESITEFYSLQVRIDVKQITDSGSVTTSASAPTTVTFNKTFKDVDSIVATVQETTQHFVVRRLYRCSRSNIRILTYTYSTALELRYPRQFTGLREV